jgi:hypothetical protein
MPVNPDDPTIPVVCSDVVVEQSEKVADGFFMRILHEALDSYVINTLKVKVLSEEIASTTTNLKNKTQLDGNDYAVINRLSIATDELDEARKAIASAESKLNLYTPDTLKDVLSVAPLKVDVRDVKIKVSVSEAGMYGGGGRVKIEIE